MQLGVKDSGSGATGRPPLSHPGKEGGKGVSCEC